MRNGLLVGAVCSLHMQLAGADGYRLPRGTLLAPQRLSCTGYDLRPTTYNTCQNLPHPPSRRAQGEEAMPRHLRHPRKSAFISLLFTLVATLSLRRPPSASPPPLPPPPPPHPPPPPPARTPPPP